MQIELDEGYQFGLGVFETIKLHNGQPVYLEDHLVRMNHSLRELKIRAHCRADAVLDWLAGHPAPEDAALKIIASDQNLTFFYRQDPYSKREESGGQPAKLDYSGIVRSSQSRLVRHKTLNYGDCILEKRRASKLGLDDLIFCNEYGQITEGTTTNLFFLREGRLFTPALSCGLLPGIMRRKLMDRMPVKEALLYREDLPSMEACLISNSLMGLRPVARLTDIRFCVDAANRVIRESGLGEV